MALTARQIIRILIGDREKVAVKEYVGVGDNANLTFQFDMFPVSSDTVTLYLTGAAQVSAAAAITHDTGKIQFVAAPGAGHTIVANYNYFALSNAEIDEIMSGVGTASTLLVASYCAAALAADASRWFSYVMGDKEINKNDVGRKLLALSQDLEKKFYTRRDDLGIDVTMATFQDLPTGSPYYDYDTGTTIED